MLSLDYPAERKGCENYANIQSKNIFTACKYVFPVNQYWIYEYNKLTFVTSYKKKKIQFKFGGKLNTSLC